MRARAGVCALLACAAALVAGGSPAGACACGVAIEASVGEEQALVVDHHHRESILLSLDLASDSAKARPAIVVPVPGVPEVAAIEHGDPLAYLERATTPEPEPGASGGVESAGAGVDVLGRDEIGGYDVARLGAADGAALERWLGDNDYTLPAGAEPILSDYADEDWRFVAIKLAAGSKGRLRPLKISFDSDETIYPMRLEQLATEPLALTLFVLAPAERRVKGLDRTFSGTVDELDPPPPAALEDLFGSDDHVTRIEAHGDASGFKRDLVIEALPKPPGVSGNDEEGFSTRDFVLVAAGGLLALAVAFAIRMRRRRLI